MTVTGPDGAPRQRLRFNPEITFGNVLTSLLILGGLLSIYTKSSSEIIGLDSRVGVLERAMVERRAEERESVADVKKQLDDVMRTLYELKFGLAEKTKPR